MTFNNDQIEVLTHDANENLLLKDAISERQIYVYKGKHEKESTSWWVLNMPSYQAMIRLTRFTAFTFTSS
jgi:hypothetical protein